MRDIIQDLKKLIKDGSILENELMSNHTTLRIGGKARFFISVSNEIELKELVNYLSNNQERYFIIGNGSNLLVLDEGFDGVIIKLDGRFRDCIIGSVDASGSNNESTDIEAGAGALLSAVSNKAMENSLQGMEFASGIPGSMGGAIVMNAGAYGGEMKGIVSSVRVLEKDVDTGIFDFKIYDNEEMKFSYRHSLAKEKEMIICSVTLELTKGDKDEIKKTMDELNTMRRDKQPLEFPSAGSTFKRPEGYFAGKLISDAGLKGYQVGDAKVSEKHAGFCINVGNASSADFIKLMNDVSTMVKEKFDVELEPEVIVLK